MSLRLRALVFNQHEDKEKREEPGRDERERKQYPRSQSFVSPQSRSRQEEKVAVGRPV